MLSPEERAAGRGRPDDLARVDPCGPADEAAWLADQRRRWAVRRAWLAGLEKHARRLRAVRRGGDRR